MLIVIALFVKPLQVQVFCILARLFPIALEYFGRPGLFCTRICGQQLTILPLSTASPIGIPSRACEAHVQVLLGQVGPHKVVLFQVLQKHAVDSTCRGNGQVGCAEPPVPADLPTVWLTAGDALLASSNAVQVGMLPIIDVGPH